MLFINIIKKQKIFLKIVIKDTCKQHKEEMKLEM